MSMARSTYPAPARDAEANKLLLFRLIPETPVRLPLLLSQGFWSATRQAPPRPVPAARQSAASCRQIAASSDGSPPTAANSTGRASPIARPSLPALLETRPRPVLDLPRYGLCPDGPVLGISRLRRSGTNVNDYTGSVGVVGCLYLPRRRPWAKDMRRRSE
jgi:hypothetical protein